MLQRVLGSHPQVSTTAETWLLLPQLYLLRQTGVYAEYLHGVATQAILDFARQLPHGIDSYKSAIHDFVIDLYSQSSSDSATYFVDKTPRYSLIVDSIIDMFPDAKHVFLWRNPLAIVASIIQTWGNGRWNIDRFYIDLYQGMDNLCQTFRQRHAEVYSINYEHMVEGNIDIWRQLFDYLELSFNTEYLGTFNQMMFRGKMGDKTGIHQYNEISVAPVAKWKNTLRSPQRKRWGKKYLRWLGSDRLEMIGYSLDNLELELESIMPVLHTTVSDAFFGPYRKGQRVLEYTFLGDKLQSLRNPNYVVEHW